eukprot:gb/GEZN01011964.1/.p1 GENE.gb/GEZN01011964.1/~~gb/GEZN01011964.1/.p1  ORF type:complete len:197 (-),score=17.98 gb/GEZN01011964.1/:525-1037(-)
MLVLTLGYLAGLVAFLTFGTLAHVNGTSEEDDQKICNAAVYGSSPQPCKWEPCSQTIDGTLIETNCLCGAYPEDYLCIDPSQVEYVMWVWAAAFGVALLLGLMGYYCSGGTYNCCLGTMFCLCCGGLSGSCYCTYAKDIEQIRARERKEAQMQANLYGDPTHEEFRGHTV